MIRRGILENKGDGSFVSRLMIVWLVEIVISHMHEGGSFCCLKGMEERVIQK